MTHYVVETRDDRGDWVACIEETPTGFEPEIYTDRAEAEASARWYAGGADTSRQKGAQAYRVTERQLAWFVEMETRSGWWERVRTERGIMPMYIVKKGAAQVALALTSRTKRPHRVVESVGW